MNFDYFFYPLRSFLSTTARQAVKNTPKRLPSVTVRSPLGASPPNIDSQADCLVSTPPMDTGGVASDDSSTHSIVRRILTLRDYCLKWCFLDLNTVDFHHIFFLFLLQLCFIHCCFFQCQGVRVFLPMTDGQGPGPKDGGLAAIIDDSPQKRVLAQKVTPPPSPLLSELLKKGNLISVSPRLVRPSLTLNQNVKDLQEYQKF